MTALLSWNQRGKRDLSERINLNPILIEWLPIWQRPAVFSLFEAWFLLWSWGCQENRVKEWNWIITYSPSCICQRVIDIRTNSGTLWGNERGKGWTSQQLTSVFRLPLCHASKQNQCLFSYVKLFDIWCRCVLYTYGKMGLPCFYIGFCPGLVCKNPASFSGGICSDLGVRM